MVQSKDFTMAFINLGVACAPDPYTQAVHEFSSSITYIVQFMESTIKEKFT